MSSDRGSESQVSIGTGRAECDTNFPLADSYQAARRSARALAILSSWFYLPAPKRNQKRTQIGIITTMAMTARYTVINGEIISEQRGSSRRTYVPDANGNTVALVDDTGTVTDTFSYWPYGEVKTRTGSTPAPFRFGGVRGWYTNGDSVFVNPVYDPKTGSWRTAVNADDVRRRKRITPAPIGIRYPGASIFNPFDAARFQYGHYCGKDLFCEPQLEDSSARSCGRVLPST